MSDGFFHWYRTGWEVGDADRLLQGVVAAGLHLANPATGRISVITNGPDSWGEQVFVSGLDLLKHMALETRTEANYQLWLDPDTDIFTRVRRLSETAVVVEFGLDGMTGPEQDRAVDALTRALRTAGANCFGFVVDRLGVTEELDWDAVMTGAPVRVLPLPDRFGIPAGYLPTHPELARDQVTLEGELAVFSRTR